MFRDIASEAHKSINVSTKLFIIHNNNRRTKESLNLTIIILCSKHNKKTNGRRQLKKRSQVVSPAFFCVYISITVHIIKNDSEACRRKSLENCFQYHGLVFFIIIIIQKGKEINKQWRWKWWGKARSGRAKGARL